VVPAFSIQDSAVRLRDLVLAAVVVTVMSPLWFLPGAAAARLGRAYGMVAYWFWPLGRRTAMINLRRAYGPSMTRDRARRATRCVFRSLGQSIAEAIQFARRFKDGQPGWDAVYRAEDPVVERGVLADPRPKIFVTGHLGSWEVAAMLAGLRAGDKGAAIARRIDNPFLNAIVRRGRLRRASQWIEKKGAGAEALRRLQAGESIALLGDETSGPRGVFVGFFGRAASTSKTPALLSLMTGAPVVLGAAVRRGSDEPLLVRLKMLEPSAYASLGGAAIARMTADIAASYEQWVRDDPWQWRWVHWRWKHRPDGSEERYRRRDLASCFEEHDSGTPLPATPPARTRPAPAEWGSDRRRNVR
jgi:KDO2-lipid IV(A) lauroyltransferase